MKKHLLSLLFGVSLLSLFLLAGCHAAEVEAVKVGDEVAQAPADLKLFSAADRAPATVEPADRKFHNPGYAARRRAHPALEQFDRKFFQSGYAANASRSSDVRSTLEAADRKFHDAGYVTSAGRNAAVQSTLDAADRKFLHALGTGEKQHTRGTSRQR